MIEIKEKAECCGCNACVQRCPKSCIAMREDEEGFLYPVVDRKICVDCGLCEMVCPVLNQGKERKPLQVYAAKNKNEAIRMQSSSGGIFTLLAEQIICEGGVVFGARFNETWEVVHDYTEKMEGLAPFRGSKYVQSRVGETYIQAEQFLQKGRKVLFSGTPCQIAGLKLFLRKEYENLLTVDVVCHAVPSPRIWKIYISNLGKQLNWNVEDIVNINFRDKKDGWKNYKFTIRKVDGATYSESSGKNCFMKGFLMDLYTRPSCASCLAKGLFLSDITIGDFWGIHTLLPCLDDNKGISAIVVNSEKGRSVLNRLAFQAYSVKLEDLFKRNSALLKSVIFTRKREQFYNQLIYTNLCNIISTLSKKSLSYKIGLLIERVINKIIIRSHL